MTGNFDQPKHTGASAAWPEASCVSLRSQGLAQPGTNLVQADDILTPEELAARLKVPDSWVYEKTRGRGRNPIPCLRLWRYVRFNWVAVVTWLAAPAPHDATPTRPSLPNRRNAPRPVPPRPA
jgi:hypothetical protein